VCFFLGIGWSFRFRSLLTTCFRTPSSMLPLCRCIFSECPPTVQTAFHVFPLGVASRVCLPSLPIFPHVPVCSFPHLAVEVGLFLKLCGFASFVSATGHGPLVGPSYTSHPLFFISRIVSSKNRSALPFSAPADSTRFLLPPSREPREERFCSFFFFKPPFIVFCSA